ncbi:MAG: CvpA family protein [Rhodobacteraceae bacterium]|nr:CvpA family protein [Paracoccaceae bacterium]
MDNLELTNFDFISGTVIVASLLVSLNRGLVREAMSIIGWIFATLVAYFAAPLLNPHLATIAYVGPLLESSCELSMVLAFTISFAFSLLIWSMLTTFITTLTNLPILSALDRYLGLVFGAVRGFLFVSIILIVNQSVVPAGSVYDAISDSKSADIFENLSTAMLERMPDLSSPPAWVLNSYSNLMSTCDHNITTISELPSIEVPEDVIDATGNGITDRLPADQTPADQPEN